MVDRALADQKAQTFFEDLWQRGDFWGFESSEYERARCAHLLKMLDGRRYERVLEIGCGAGYFTRLLARIADQVVALDISPSAIARARALGASPGAVDFRVANIMDYQCGVDGPWDLMVMTDISCYLGWLYPFFDIAWLAAQLFTATRCGGSFLLANSMVEDGDALLLPWYIRTYRDLFLNVGYQLEAEEIFQGTKNGVAFEVLSSLLIKPPEKNSTEEIAESPV